MHDVTRLIVWKRAIRLALDVGRTIPTSAGRRAPGLRNQAMRAAERISDALAEGCGKSSDWELARYADIANGSVSELQNQLVLARGYGIIDAGRFKTMWKECAELRKMLHSFQRAVRERAAAADDARSNGARNLPTTPPESRHGAGD